MQHSTGKPTKAQECRFMLIQEIGCIACRKDGHFHVPPQIHHIVEGGKRLGHDWTIGLCELHHKPHTLSISAPIVPSIHYHKKAFQARYGTELELLDETNELLGLAA